MGLESAVRCLDVYGFKDRVKLLDESSATVDLAAEAVGVEPDQIAKTLSFLVKDVPVLVLASGKARIDNHKFKEEFKTKAKMIHSDQVEALVGHAPGGVCPFGVKKKEFRFISTTALRNMRSYIRQQELETVRLS